MRKFAMMSVCGLAMMVGSGQQSEAGCLLGWLFPCFRPQTCCYAPPPCCPTTCGPTTCGYASGCSSCSGIGCSACSSCTDAGCSTFSSYGSTPAYSSPCGPGGCSSTLVPLPTSIAYDIPQPMPQSSITLDPQPATVARQAAEPRTAFRSRIEPVSHIPTQETSSASNSGWEPIVDDR